MISTPSSTSNTSHTYNNSGIYRVTLIVWDNTGRSARAEKTVTIGGGSTTPTPTPTPASTPTPTPTPISGQAFVKGINFNGNAVTIEGNNWLSYSSALSAGLSISLTPNLGTTSLTPNPSTDAATSSMLNSVIWHNNSFTVNQTLSNGNYQIYIWLMENYQNNFRSMNVILEGTQVASAIGNLIKNSWVKYGPYNVTVNDGTMNMGLVKVTGDPNIMGMAIYSN